MTDSVEILSYSDNTSGKKSIAIIEVEYIIECEKESTDLILNELNKDNIIVFVSGKSAKIITNVLIQSLPFRAFALLFTDTFTPSIRQILDAFIPLLDEIYRTLPISVYIEEIDEYTDMDRQITYYAPSTLFGEI
jgi:hypothetical protein